MKGWDDCTACQGAGWVEEYECLVSPPGTPSTLEEAIKRVLTSGKSITMWPPEAEEVTAELKQSIRDFASQRFTSAMMLASEEEAEELERLFKRIFD